MPTRRPRGRRPFPRRLASILMPLSLGVTTVSPGQIVTPPTTAAPTAVTATPARTVAPERPDANPWNLAERIDFERPDVARLRAEDRLNAVTGTPRRVGVNQPLAAAIDRHAGWTDEPTGGVAFRQTLVATGATAVRVWFENVRLPEGVTLRVTTPDGGRVAVMRATNDPDADPDNQPDAELWTPLLDGDTALIEAWSPDRARLADASFTIGGIAHIYAGLNELAGLGEITDATVPCSRHVDCSTLGPAAGILDAVGRMCYSRGRNQFVCTATLIADLDPATQRPLLLTAEHCIGSRSEARSVVVTWDYRSPTCSASTPDFASLEQSSGAELLVADTVADTTLLELDAAPAPGRTFAPWTTALPRDNETLRSLHHPGGGPQEIAVFDIGEPTLTFVGATRADFHIVRPTDGAIRTGSSGAPLVNENGQIIGVASFSAVVPDELIDSCDGSQTARVPAGYGRFDRAFPLLEPFLQPADLPDLPRPPVIAAVELAPATVEAGSNAAVTATAVGVTDDAGILRVRFRLDANTNSLADAGEPVADDTSPAGGFTATLPTQGLAPGLYTITAIATDTQGLESLPREATLTITSAPSAGADRFLPQDTPQTIPDAGSTTSTITIAADACITDLDAAIDIAHPQRSDLIVELVSPAGTTVRLHDREGFGQSDLTAAYNDDARRPDGPGLLADFTGQRTKGAWSLRVTDAGAGGTGVLLDWSLTIQTGPDGCGPATVPPAIETLSADPATIRANRNDTVRAEARPRAGTSPVARVTFTLDTNGNGLPDDPIAAADTSPANGWTATLRPAATPPGVYTVLAQARDSQGLEGNIARATIVLTSAETTVATFAANPGTATEATGGSVLVSDPGSATTTNEAGSVNVVTRTTADSGTAVTQTLTPADAGQTPQRLDLFGNAIARDAATLAVGAPGDDAAGPDAGAVHLFTLTSTGWTATGTLYADRPAPGALFGSTLDLAGDLLAVGAPFAPAGNATRAGTVDVFTAAPGNTFTRIATLAEPDRAGPDARFGQTIAADADRIVIGAPTASARGPFSGEAFLYERSGTALSTGTQLDPPTPAPADLFGSAVAIENTLIAVGARGRDLLPAAPDAGVAHVFRITPTNESAAPRATLEATLADTTPAARQALGAALDITAARIAIGGPGTPASPDATQGIITLFERTGPNWTLIERVQDPRPAFGRTVTFDGTDLLVGYGSEAGSGVVALLDITTAASTAAPASRELPPAPATTTETNSPPPCTRADLAAPFGSLTPADAAAFTALYTRRDPAADLNADGRINNEDLLVLDRALAGDCR